MKTFSTQTLASTLALLIAATGCTAGIDADDDGMGDDGGGGGGGGDEPAIPTDASGKYSMRSNFDLATNAPGKVGEVTRTFIAATDDPDDPTSWLLDQVIAGMNDGWVKDFVEGSKPYIAGYLNDRLLEFAPDLLGTLVQVGDDFGQLSKNFGLNATLEIVKAGEGYMATHTVLGTHFKIDNIESDHAFADFGAQPIVAQSVAATFDQTGKLTIADHSVALSYGKILRVGVDGMIIPMVDPSASNLGQLLNNKVNCNIVGEIVRQAIEDAFGYGGSASTYAGACRAGLVKAADLVYSKINDIDGSALELGLSGVAKALDTDSNGSADKIQTGTWTGNASYAGTPAPLAGATFFGQRM